MNIQDAASPTEFVVGASIVHGADAILSQRRRTHDTWLDRDIEIGHAQDAGRMVG